MSGYLEGYGEGEERRSKIIKWTVLGAIAVLVLGAVSYFGFRNFSKRQKLDTFLELLKKQDYKAAHALWGCTDQAPCRDYSFDRFMEDWGPKSPAAKADTAAIVSKATCGPFFQPTGILRIYHFAPDYTVSLWVNSEDGNIGFAPVIQKMQCTILP